MFSLRQMQSQISKQENKQIQQGSYFSWYVMKPLMEDGIPVLVSALQKGTWVDEKTFRKKIISIF